MTTWSRTAVLNLYRSMLRKGRSLELTNRDYYFNRIKKEFNAAKNIEDDSEKLHRLKVITRVLKSEWATEQENQII